MSNQHTWNTIQILLSSIGAVDLPFFDLIISGNPNPYIICSKKNTLDALSEKSQIWPIVFDLINKNIKNNDLASAIKAAYNLHNSRKSEYPDFLFAFPVLENSLPARGASFRIRRRGTLPGF